MPFLKPRQDNFFTLFNEISADIRDISVLFADLSHSFNTFESFAKRACEIEKRADEKTHAIIEELHSSFVTPFDREDVYALAHKLDDIIDLTENVIRDIALYNFHKRINTMDEFSTLFVDNAQLTGQMIKALPIIRPSSELRNLKIRIHENEDRGDQLFATAMRDLFKKETDPVEIIKQKNIIEDMENIMDTYQSTSNLIEGIAIKHG